ncbi:MAG: hypothetical protein WCS37_16670 [Chloroflexota bacterium]
MTTPERQTQLNKLLTDAEALKIDLQKKQVFSSDPKEQKRLELEIEQTRLHIEEFQAELGLLLPSTEVIEQYLKLLINFFDKELIDYTPLEASLHISTGDLKRADLIDLTCLRYAPKTEKGKGRFDVLEEKGFPVFAEDSLHFQREECIEGTLFDQMAAVSRGALLGAPGAGKTFSFRRLAHYYARQYLDLKNSQVDVASATKDFHRGKIPLVIPLGGYKPSTKTPLEYITDFLRKGAQGYPFSPELADCLLAALKAGKVLILFDAVNEVAEDERQQAFSTLSEFALIQATHNNSIFFSCREKDYLQNLADLPRLVLKELDDEHIRLFLSHHCDQVNLTQLEARLDENNQQLRKLVRNPFMLRVLINVYRMAQGQLPSTRGELFCLFGHFLLSRALTKPDWKAWLSKLVPEQNLTDPDFGQLAPPYQKTALERLALVVEPMLGQLAFNMLLNPQWGTRLLVTDIKGYTLIPDYLEKEFSYLTSDFDDEETSRLRLTRGQVLNLATKAGLLRLTKDEENHKKNSIEFSHQLLEEYFAASYLRGLEPSSPEWRKAANRYDFDEVFPLLADLYQDPAEVIRLVWSYDFELACSCALLLPKESLSENLSNWLVAELETLLKEDFKPNWNKALQALCDLKAIPSLVAVVTKHQDSDVRRIAANALAGLGAKEAIPHLINQLRQGSYRLYTLGWYSLVA